MKNDEINIQFPPQIHLGGELMAAWFKTMLAASDQWFKFWTLPFSTPIDHEKAGAGELDIPGPLERDHEHNLFA